MPNALRIWCNTTPIPYKPVDGRGVSLDEKKHRIFLQMRHSGAFAALFNECVLPNDPAAGHHWGIIDAFWLLTGGDPFAPGQFQLLASGRMIELFGGISDHKSIQLFRIVRQVFCTNTESELMPAALFSAGRSSAGRSNVRP